MPSPHPGETAVPEVILFEFHLEQGDGVAA